MDKKFISLTEAADYTGLSESMIEYFRQVGDFPYHRDSKDGVWFVKSELRQWFSRSNSSDQRKCIIK